MNDTAKELLNDKVYTVTDDMLLVEQLPVLSEYDHGTFTTTQRQPYKVVIEVYDEVIERVIRKIAERSAVGIDKYNTTLDASPETNMAFLNHLQEEMLDGANYVETIKYRFENRSKYNTKLLKD